MQKHKIIIKQLHLHGRHGVMPQERTVGADFTLDLEIDTDFTKAMNDDDLSGTISYAEVYETVKLEMAEPSKLLEHAAGRIVMALMQQFPSINGIKLRLLKDNPPVGAQCEGMGVEIEERRSTNYPNN